MAEVVSFELAKLQKQLLQIEMSGATIDRTKPLSIYTKSWNKLCEELGQDHFDILCGYRVFKSDN